MIELTQDQAQAVERNGKEPPLVVDPMSAQSGVGTPHHR
jgi:hypothetical protein